MEDAITHGCIPVLVMDHVVGVYGTILDENDIYGAACACEGGLGAVESTRREGCEACTNTIESLLLRQHAAGVHSNSSASHTQCV